LTAIQYAAGNLIELKTGHEASSLGFNLYREQNGQRVKLNPSLLAGTALLAGSATAFSAGHSHAWLDDAAGGSEASYWVEEVDTSGERTLFGPVRPAPPAVTEISASTSPLVARQGGGVRAQARMLSGLGRETAPTKDPAGSDPVAQPVPLAAHGIAKTDRAMQYRLAARPAIKLGIDAEGWYSVSQPELVAAGLDPNTQANTLQLYAEGVEQSMVVHSQPDGRLGPQGSIEFYATGRETTWSSLRAYWLVWGEGWGRRVRSLGLKSRVPAGLRSFPFTLQWKPRTIYFAALLNGDEDNFFGPVLSGVEAGGSSQPVTRALTVAHLDASGSAQLQVRLQGVSAGNHEVAVAINGYRVGALQFSHRERGLAGWPVPPGVLQPGSNNLLTLTVEGGAEDISLVDRVLLTYPHTYFADHDSLRLSVPAGQRVTIGGFSGRQVQVMDVTDPAAVLSVPGTITPQPDGSYTISVVSQLTGTRTLLAFTSTKASRPASITLSHPSSWHAAQPGADMVIISHANFLQTLGPLQALREGQGHTVTVIDVADLYDEFNYGAKSPYAIKTFLATASARWATPPKWVLLVGDATFDPHNYLGVGDFDFLPTYLAETALLETASDDWFADLNHRGLPEMAVGRLPVRTAEEATAVVNKIVAHEQSSSGAWKNQVLLVSGTGDDSNPFEAYTSLVEGLLPPNVTVSKVLAGSDSNPHAHLLSNLNNGQAVVNYIGHGSDEDWAGGLLDSAQAGTLLNGSQTPFVIAMTCLNGYFQDVYTVALAKALIKAPGGGAVAVWASSGLTGAASQSMLDQAMIRALYGAPSRTLGEAAVVAKGAVSDRDIRRTWILFGDPATKLY
jgi:hypothetical protein